MPYPISWIIFILDSKPSYTDKLNNKANTTYTESPFFDLHLSIANGFIFSKIYDKRDDFDFDIVNFPFLDGDVPRRASHGVYKIQDTISLLENP